ncbi:putative ABC transporter permease [Candidatus Saccharibacteria bacterium]|nr:putative ABC transporter permease [Candidatus Saccharibacteria bacterium]
MNLNTIPLVIDGNFFHVAAWFFIYCFLGWLWESAYRSYIHHRPINSGFLVGPYIPIYGFGALLYIGLLHFTTRPVELFFLGGLLACSLEFITSWLLEKIFHARWWDYSERFGNINGRVCVTGYLAFGAFAVLLPIVHRLIGVLVANIASPWLEIGVMAALLIVLGDTTTTVAGLFKFNKVLSRYQKNLSHHLSFIQRRTLRNFPNFNSIKYPEALHLLNEFYLSINRKLKDHQLAPNKTKPSKKA